MAPSNEIHVLTNYPIAVMNTSMGSMTFVLYTDKMPITSDNFIKLADINFFENIVFHRVIDDFVIQGGGFYANGTSKRSPFGTIKLETHPDVLHVDGAISMARTMMPNSATSQFFICDGPSPHLDGNKDDEEVSRGDVSRGPEPGILLVLGSVLMGIALYRRYRYK